MFGNSFTKQSQILYIAKLIEINTSWIFQEHIPNESDMQLDGISSLFGKRKKEKMKLITKRSAFMCGVMEAAAFQYFDGKDKHYTKFIHSSIKEAFGNKHGNLVIKTFVYKKDAMGLYQEGFVWCSDRLN